MAIASFSGLASGIQWRDMIEQIMQLESARKLAPVQTQLNTRQNRQTAWNSFSSLISKLDSASDTLRDGSAFALFSTSVAKSAAGDDLLTVSASATAAPGTYSVEVTSLARAEKLNGSAVADASAELGLSAGEFHVNGRKVTVASTDSLVTLRDKINQANGGTDPSGVTATIISTSSTSHRLVLTADNTGSRGIELVDGSSGALQSLGIVNATQSANTSPTDATRTETMRFQSKTTRIASLLGVTSPPAVTTIKIDGQKIQVDLENDTLISIMNRVQEAGGSASMVEEVVGGDTQYRLSVRGSVTADTDPDANAAASQRIVELLGFVQNGKVATITSGADASFGVDGFAMTRRTNTVSDAVAGLTLNLQKASAGETVNVTVARDLDKTVKSVEGFVKAYNEIVKFVDSQRKPGTPLYANGALRSMMASLKDVVLSDIEGISSSDTEYTRAATVGISLASTGQLELNSSKLKDALTSNLLDVKTLFASTGVATDGEVSYVNSTSSTEPGTYAVSITAAATRASHTGSDLGAGFTYTASDGVSDTLRITDDFTGLSLDFVVEQGASLSSIASELDAQLENAGLSLDAEMVGNTLKITGKEYGTAATFSVAAGEAANRLGLTAATYAGTDVQGTIGVDPDTGVAYAATGKGQVLTADSGSPAAGLSIQYTGSAAKANAGTLKFVLGIAGTMERVADAQTRSGDGLITSQTELLDSSIETLNRRIADIEMRLELRREALVRQFTRMEEALSRVQSQGSWLSAQVGSLPKWSTGA